MELRELGTARGLVCESRISMSETFDPYYKWLGIPPKQQPPNHYRLLGLDLFESDADVIDAAAARQAAYLQGCATGPHLALSQRLLNEIAAARLCLLDPTRRKAYDDDLREQAAAAQERETAALLMTPVKMKAPEAKVFRHFYTATKCPQCGNDLTKPGSVLFGYVMSDRIEQAPSSLRPDGLLRDVNNVISRGFHSYTQCARCSRDLAEIENYDKE
jgi:hypothetical protein